MTFYAKILQDNLPAGRTVTIRYGRIPGYRNPGRKSWGFWFSNIDATELYYEQYTCPRRSAKKLFDKKLKPVAESRGFVVLLVVDPESCLNSDLSQIKDKK